MLPGAEVQASQTGANASTHVVCAGGAGAKFSTGRLVARALGVAEVEYRRMDEQRPDLIYARDLNELLDSRRAHARAVESGEETRVSHGVYVASDAWGEVADYERYLLRVRAIALTRKSRPVLSHWSAAAVHGLPRAGSWPREVHTIVGQPAGGRSKGGVIKHYGRLPEEDVVEIGGLLVTSVARTVVDLAMTASFAAATVVADRAQLESRAYWTPPMATKDALQRTLNRLMPVRAHRRAQQVIDFSVNCSESPLESESRVSMHVVGCPKPELQVSYWDAGGFIGRTDFSWPEYSAVGEADGKLKYFDERYLNGRTAQEVVDAERIRHNRLAALPRTVIRWDWATGTDPAKLRARLLQAGIPLRSA